MATYEELHGKRVEVFSSDPTLDSSYEGQVWFNSTSGTLKSVLSTGAWVSATPSPNGGSSRMGFGIQTAALIAGGATGPGNQTYAEEYNGSGWTSATAMPGSRQDGGSAGTQTAGLLWCGEGPAKLNTTIEYDGSSWSSGGAYPITARGVRGSGSQTAALGCGGNTTAPAASNVSAEYDGSSWTAGNNLPGNRVAACTSGPQTSALATTGKDNTPNPSVSNLNTAYDGTNWTAQTVYPLSLRQAASTGTSSSANLVAGGVGATPFTDAVTTAAQWDGSSWTTTGSLGTKSTHMGYAGTSTASMISGGTQDYPSYPGVTQEFNQSINTITAAAWSSSGNVPVSIRGGGSGGTKNGAWMSGGLKNSPSTDRNDTYLYDGSAWTAGNDLPNNYFIGGGTGPQTAGLLWNGIVSGGGPATSTYEFDGTNWTSGGSFPAIGPNGSQGSTGAGVGQTAAVAMGGTGDPPPAQSDRMVAYDGSTWSSDTSMPTGVSGCAADGPNTAIWIAGGYTNPDTTSTSSKEYDGSSWTTTGNTASPVPQGLQFQGWGPQTSAIIAGGSSSAPTNHTCQQYNGTIWVTAASLGTGRNNHSFCSKTAGTKDGFVAGGYEDSGNTNATEEFTDETSVTTAKTLTTS